MALDPQHTIGGGLLTLGPSTGPPRDAGPTGGTSPSLYLFAPQCFSLPSDAHGATAVSTPTPHSPPPPGQCVVPRSSSHDPTALLSWAHPAEPSPAVPHCTAWASNLPYLTLSFPHNPSPPTPRKNNQSASDHLTSFLIAKLRKTG